MAEQRKRELVAQLAVARRNITLGKERVGTQLNPALQFRNSVKNHPTGWIAGTLGAATVLGFLKRKQPKTKVVEVKSRLGFFRWIFGVIFALVRPSLSKLVLDRLKIEAENRFSYPSSNSRLGAPVQK